MTQDTTTPPRKLPRRWLPRPGGPVSISQLLDAASGDMPLAERHLWLVQLMDWVRAGEPVSGVKYIVRQLAPPSERRTRVVALLSAFWRDIDVAALLADYGFAARTSFIDELGERLRTRMLPMSPATTDLASLFNLLFSDARDTEWLLQLDDAVLDDLAALWREAIDAIESEPLGWHEPFYDAIMFLSSQVRAEGFSRELRGRMGMRVDIDFDGVETGAEVAAPTPTRQAFRQLVHVAENLHVLALKGAVGPSPDAEAPGQTLLQEAQYLRALLDTCVKSAQGIHDHLESNGVSIDIVFQIDQLSERCRRIEQLLDCLLSSNKPADLRALIVDLVRVGAKRHGVRALFTQHYSLLVRKVAERSAETGETYITRDRAEYLTMLRRACGGGAVMAGTTFMKFAILAIGLSPFWSGLAAGTNYATSFVIILLLHFTVATKQPAMTAPAMAAKLADTRSDESVEGFVDEVANLIRSQVAGILGNVLVVAPTVLALQALSWWVFKRPLIDIHSAQHVLDSLTLLGPTLWYAGFTGVLLFCSSLFGGWLENWFVLHRLDSALRWNPRIRATLGAERAARWATWWRKNISGVASNVSLGLMLGLVPVIAGFFALPFDVRHVTLSTGQIAAAAGTLGPQVLHHPQFWWCVAAIPLTGLLNVGVSFVLALRLAIRSRGVRVKDRARLQAALWRRLRRHPLSFLLPPR